MILNLSESNRNVKVTIIVEISAPISEQMPPLCKAVSEIGSIEDEILDQALDQAHNQLPPLLRKARLLIEASLVNVVSYKMRDLLPNVQSSGTRDQMT